MRSIFFFVFAAGAAGMSSTDRAAEHVVSQKNKSFSVNALSVKVGERVVFTNDDAFAHNVFSSSAGFIFNLKVQAPGASMPISFDQPGTVDVRCAFHPTMKLSVTVK
jgi:plastocyanin